MKRPYKLSRLCLLALMGPMFGCGGVTPPIGTGSTSLADGPAVVIGEAKHRTLQVTAQERIAYGRCIGVCFRQFRLDHNSLRLRRCRLICWRSYLQP
jgi:hypothetical protein